MKTASKYGYAGKKRKRKYARKEEIRYILAAAVSILLLVCVSAGLVSRENKAENTKAEKKEAEKDPHEGQVYLYDGFDWIWMTPLEGVAVNDFTEDDFAVINGKIEYVGDKYETFRGIDVSEHQKEIDWKAVAASGVDYAYIRVGRRGYTEGGLFDDAYFQTNILEAQAAGLKTGVYIFSQAVSVEEAIEEADFLIDKVQEYKVPLPVVYDWEKISEDGSRTAELSTETRTDCAVAFCETIRNAGYVPCVYINRNMGYYGYDLSRLDDYQIWFSLPESGFPNFYYHVDMWQYSFTETVPGISVETDMNLWLVPKEETVSSNP